MSLFFSPSIFSSGFAFLVFEEPDAVDKVLNDSPHTICDKVVDAKKAIPHAVHQVRGREGGRSGARTRTAGSLKWPHFPAIIY